MSILKPVRVFGAAALISAVSSVAVVAQTTAPSPAPETASPPAASKPDAAPPASRPATTPAAPSSDKSVKAPDGKEHALMGLAVFSSDGNRLGAVQSVSTDSAGKATAIRIKSGGFLGFGGKLVEIPEGKFTRSGENIQLGMTSEEVSKLPEVKNQS
jgi:hypothetical protein